MGDVTKGGSTTSQVTAYGQGNNCTLSYVKGSVRHSIRLRCIAISHGFQVLGDESQARTHRAFYPRQVVPSQFAMTFALKARSNLPPAKTITVRGKRVSNISEYERFNAWMHDYMTYLLAEDEFATEIVFPKMIVSCPARNFFREGVPLGPIEYGDHVGSMLWRQSITFETTREPLDGTPDTSKFVPGFSATDRNAAYFYPEGIQLSGAEAPLIFDTVTTTEQNPLVTPEQVTAKAAQDAIDGDT